METSPIAAQTPGRVRILDAGALIALDRGERDAWALVAEGVRQGMRPAVPAPVIAQAWRGGARQARLARALTGADQVVVDGALARRAGVLLGKSKTDDIIDALVALVAADRPGWEIVTSDPDDIDHLLHALEIRRVIRRV